MNRAATIAIRLLAISPWLYLAIALPPLWFYESPVGAFIGCAAIYLPLALLLYSSSRQVPRQPVAMLWLTASTILPLIASSLMLASPQHLIKPDPSPAVGITLKPNTGYGGGLAVSGLNMRLDPILDPPEPGHLFQFRVRVPRKGGETAGGPPDRFDDGFGNSLDATLPDPTRLHLQDNLGGYADIHWDGKQLILEASHSAARSIAARGPTEFATQMDHLGHALLMLTPMLACLGLAAFTLQLRRARSLSTRGVKFSLVFQTISIALMIVLYTATFDRNDPGTPAFLILCWLICAAIGLILLTQQMLTAIPSLHSVE